MLRFQAKRPRPSMLLHPVGMRFECASGTWGPGAAVRLLAADGRSGAEPLAPDAPDAPAD